MCKLPEIIVVDLDGTLFSTDNRTILPDTYEMLKKCVEKGSKLVPATGRSEALIPLELLPPVQYIISCNGGLINDFEEDNILRAKYIPNKNVRIAWDIIKNYIRELDVVFEIFEDKQVVIERKVYKNIEYYADRIPKFHLQYIRNGKAKHVTSFDEYIVNEGTRVVKMNFPGSSIEQCPELQDKLIDMGLFEVTSDGLNLELTTKGCDKGEAMMWLSDYLKVPRKNTIAFGDGNNDLTMLNKAGWGVAMGNAADEVKAAAMYCTASNSQNGIAVFMKKFFCID
jgi:Cof subfamily protein (haloacid dehalogenase superfamily)